MLSESWVERSATVKLIDIIWYAPLAAGIVFILVSLNLAKSGAGLFKQLQRLAKLTEPLQSLQIAADDPGREFKPSTEAEARRNRKLYLAEKAKRKEDKQRRLVKNLRELTKS